MHEADEIYARILAQDPNHSDSLHLSGMAAYAKGDLERGLELDRKSVV